MTATPLTLQERQERTARGPQPAAWAMLISPEERDRQHAFLAVIDAIIALPEAVRS